MAGHSTNAAWLHARISVIRLFVPAGYTRSRQRRNATRATEQVDDWVAAKGHSDSPGYTRTGTSELLRTKIRYSPRTVPSGLHRRPFESGVTALSSND